MIWKLALNITNGLNLQDNHMFWLWWQIIKFNKENDFHVEIVSLSNRTNTLPYFRPRSIIKAWTVEHWHNANQSPLAHSIISGSQTHWWVIAGQSFLCASLIGTADCFVQIIINTDIIDQSEQSNYELQRQLITHKPLCIVLPKVVWRNGGPVTPSPGDRRTRHGVTAANNGARRALCPQPRQLDGASLCSQLQLKLDVQCLERIIWYSSGHRRYLLWRVMEWCSLCVSIKEIQYRGHNIRQRMSSQFKPSFETALNGFVQKIKTHIYMIHEYHTVQTSTT